MEIGLNHPINETSSSVVVQSGRLVLALVAADVVVSGAHIPSSVNAPRMVDRCRVSS
jgi:hypothetical protein